MKDSPRSSRVGLIGKVRPAFVIVVAALAACLVAAPFLLRAIFALEARCSLPCRDLTTKPGVNFLPGEEKLSPPCAPLELKFELAQPTARVGKRYSLWYRLTLNNRSCSRLSFDLSDFQNSFVSIGRLGSGWGGRHSVDNGLFFRVWGPDGREILSDPGRDFPNEYYPLIPYARDPSARPVATVALPGGSIRTTPSVRAPHFPDRLPGFDQIVDENKEPDLARALTRNAEAYYGAIWRKRGSPTPPKALAGFSPLDDIAFKTPGKYRIQAIFAAGVIAGPIRPVYDSLPVEWQGKLWYSEVLFGVRIQPDRDSTGYRVRVESEILDVEVVR